MQKAKLALIEWRMAILYGLLFSLTALISSFLTGVMEIDFPALSNWKKFLIILGVVLNWGNTMMAFLTNVAKKVQQGKVPFFTPDNDTKMFTKETTTATAQQTTVVSTNPILPLTNEIQTPKP